MKRLKAGVVNTLSFVKLSTFTVNSFDVTLEKVVGNGSLTITNLTDLNNLDSCKDFIRLNIDLISNELDGGEYELTITNQGSSYKYLAQLEDYTIYQYENGIYKDVVRFEPLKATPLFLNTYQGAVVGYSLRQINAGYNGDAIQVRRASDSSLQSIGFVDGELDTAAIETFCIGTTGYVSTWYDQSGNNNHATQADTAKQPIIYDGSIITSDNSKPAVYFTGDDTLRNTSSVSAFTGEFAATMLAVNKQDSSYSNANLQRSILSLNNTSIDMDFGFGYLRSGLNTDYQQRMFAHFLIYPEGGAEVLSYANTLQASSVPTSDHLHYTDHTFGANWYMYLNNGNPSNTSTAISEDSFTFDEMLLGALNTDYVSGHYLQECILYNDSKESTRTAMATDINSYYSLY